MRFIHHLLLLGTIFHPANTAWWYLSQFDSNLTLGYRGFCEIIPNLTRKQKQICHRNPDLIKVVGKGAKQGIQECQFQFRYHRWNCTTFENDLTLFGRSLVRGGSREVAFIQAITSASAVYKVAVICSKGHPKCGCSAEYPDKRTHGTKDEGIFHWEGCDQVVKYSTNFVKRFVDAPDMKLSDGKAKTTLHNNRVGRAAVRRSMVKICRCHGLSGSCSLQTCWRTLPSFRVIGNALREKYDSSIEITYKPSGRMIPIQQYQKRPGRHDLIYYEKSPNYCRYDPAFGALSTSKRPCQNVRDGEESCDIMCCSRKYEFIELEKKHFCNCTFTWCCKVECTPCVNITKEYRCKMGLPATMTSG